MLIIELCKVISLDLKDARCFPFQQRRAIKRLNSEMSFITSANLSARLPRLALRALFHLPWLLIMGWMAALSWWLTDDAFISFRYARNLLDGHGLVFNPGERVEGYTNFLWTLELAGIWGLFGVRPEHSAPWLSVAFTAGTLVAVLYQVARMPSLRHRWLVAWMSMGLVCGSATFAVWTSAGGLETRQFTFLVVAAVVLLSVHRGSRLGLLSASFSLGLASLTRPEGLLIAGCCIGWFVLQSVFGTSKPDIRGAGGRQSVRVDTLIVRMLKRVDWRAVACMVLPFALMVGAHFLFRFLYYGELLPNTYYAKFVRPWWDMGLRYYAAAGLETGLYLLVPLATASAWIRWRSHRDGIYGLALLCVVLHAVYVMRLGGDHFEWRMPDFYWPLLTVPAADAMVRLGVTCASAFGRMLPAMRRFPRLASVACALCIFALVLFYSSAMQFALLIRGAEVGTWHDAVNLKLDRQDAVWLFAMPGMDRLYRMNEELRAEMGERFIGGRFVMHRQAWDGAVKKFLSYEDGLRGKLPEDAVTVQAVLGIRGYYMPDMRIVDYHGLADKTIARNPVLHSNDERRVAHDRVPPYGYLERHGVNMRIWPAARSESEALSVAGYALHLGEDLWMPFDAIDHQWVRDRFGGLGLASVHDDASAFDVMSGIVSDRDPEIRSRFYDVHVIDDSVVYAKSPCIWDDVQHPFFLHITLTDRSDLPVELQTSDSYELSFDFWDIDIASDGSACVAIFNLPDYEIAGFRTGQMTGNGSVAWEGSHSFAAAEVVAAVRDLRRQERDPDIASVFDVFLDGDRLLYVKSPCYQQDIDNRFFLHVFPADADDLPADRRESGFENLDFSLRRNGGRVGDECVARAGLPEYETSEIMTGQFTPDGRIWEAGFKVADASSGIRIR